ncbi:MAG: protein-L-isoaspartate O-methyltransferase family protein [Gammaproteobacteria bacterium]
MQYATARHNMIEQQIRPWQVPDQHTLDLLQAIHREDFIPEAYKHLALADTCLPLSHDQITLPPRVEARIMQGLAPQAHERALEIGTGCGYLTALLASACDFVYSMDIHLEFTRHALQKLQTAGLQNIDLVTRDGLQGWPENSPYDVIAVTGSLPNYPVGLQQQLSPGGRLFVIVGHSPVMQATLVTRIDEHTFTREVLFETDIPALTGSEQTTELNHQEIQHA